MQATEEYIHVLTSALSVQTGVKIQAGDKWMANVQDKVLIYPKEQLRLLPFYAVRGLLLHELSHILHSTPTEKPKDIIAEYGEEAVYEAFDGLEDLRCESLITGLFGEFAYRAISDMNYYGVARCIDKCHGDFTRYKKWEQYLLIFHYLALADRHNDIYELVGYDCKYLTDTPNQYNMMECYWVDPKVRKHFRKTINQAKEILIDINGADNSQEVLKITVNKLLPLIKPLMDKNDKKEQQQQQPGGQQSGKQNGNQISNGNNNSQKKPNDQNNQDDSRISISGQLKNDINSEIILGKQNNGNQNGSKAGNALGKMEKRQQRLSEAETAALLRPYINTLATRLRYILQEKAATRFRGLYKQGKLLGKNAYRVLIPNEERIFSQKSTPDSPRHAVYMALDKSGSMDGDRETYAFVGGVLLKYVSKELGFPVKLYAFDNHCYQLDGNNLDLYHESGGGTSDDSALQRIYNDASGSDDNLVFLVTDGETHTGSRLEYIRRLEREKNAQIFGVGIGRDISFETVKRNYTHALHVEEPKELPGALINLLRNIIHR